MNGPAVNRLAVNWEHLKAFFWLRWRLSVNQARRGGTLNVVLMMIVAATLVATAVPLLVGCFVAGIYVLPKATPEQLLYGWDAMVAGFVFFWAIGLLAELQRSESLSLSSFLHLPVSVRGAFVINYVSSLLRLSMILFLPVMMGFGLALVVAQGPRMLIVVPATLALLLMVTAVSYQFQGWLALLMSNPRRRRTVIMIVTIAFVMVFQLPNLARFFVSWPPKSGPQQVDLAQELGELDKEAATSAMDPAERQRRQNEILQKYQQQREERNRAVAIKAKSIAWTMNLALPIGWLPLAVMTSADGQLGWALLATLAMAGIGMGCLWRAYRTTIGLYQGQATRKASAAALAAAESAPEAMRAKPGKASAGLLARHIAGVSEPVSAVALAGMQSMLRAPESKLMVLTPVILAAVFGSIAWRSVGATNESLRALMGIAAIGTTLFAATQLMANQFGFDRAGFRVYVLCAASRRDILLGKNLAFAPTLLAIAALLLVVLQCIVPLRWDHLLAMAPQAVAMYLLFCLSMNLLSIYAPMYIAAGSLNPASPKLVPILLQLLMLMGVLPILEGATLLPLGVEALTSWLGWTGRAPVYLLLTTLQCAVVVQVYRWLIAWQGDLLRLREQRILEIVTNRPS